MRQYLDAVRTVLDTGTRKENRTGVDTLSTFGVHYNIDLREGFPLLTTKKINWKHIVVENLWFLSGEPKIDLLKKHGCKFWDAWADLNGNVPSAYGNFWRRFPVHVKRPEHNQISNLGKPRADALWNDQIAWVVDELKRNPMSRRLVVSAWAPGNAQSSRLPPCHIQFILNTQMLETATPCTACEGAGTTGFGADGTYGPCHVCDGEGRHSAIEPHLCLHLTQRSCDIALGVPYNIAGYAFLLELFAQFAGMPAGLLSHTLVDAHAYTSKPDGSQADMDHVSGLREQLTRAPKPLPRLTIADGIQELSDIDNLLTASTDEVMGAFHLGGYAPHPAIKFKVAV